MHALQMSNTYLMPNEVPDAAVYTFNEKQSLAIDTEITIQLKILY